LLLKFCTTMASEFGDFREMRYINHTSMYMRLSQPGKCPTCMSPQNSKVLLQPYVWKGTGTCSHTGQCKRPDTRLTHPA
jgi:hypothetical protein